LCQLEWSLFQLDTFAWGIREKETEVDVNDVSLDINQDISIMPVFNL